MADRTDDLGLIEFLVSLRSRIARNEHKELAWDYGLPSIRSHSIDEHVRRAYGRALRSWPEMEKFLRYHPVSDRMRERLAAAEALEG